MSNLSGQNPNLAPSAQVPRRADALDDLLVIGTFAAISQDTNGTGIAFKAEDVEGYHAVVSYLSHASDATNNWTIIVQGADNASYNNPVTLASIVLSSGVTKKEYLALEGAAVRSLMRAAGRGEATHVRAIADETLSPGALTAKVYLTCD
jgi:hypothetical protein